MTREDSIKRIYSYLKTLNGALNGTSETLILDGSWNRYNKFMKELEKLTGDDNFSSYEIEAKWWNSYDSNAVLVEEFQRKVNNASFYLYETVAKKFDTPPVATHPVASGTHVIQNVENSNTVNIEFNITMIEISKSLARAEGQFKDEGSKEHKFIKKIGEIIPTVKTSVELFKAILDCAKALGIDLNTVQSIFS